MDHKNEAGNEKPKGNILQNENRKDEENPVEDTNLKTDNKNEKSADEKNPTAAETD